MSWKKLLESVSESLNDHLRLRNDYLIAENRTLRRQIDGRVQLTDSERKELAEIGAKLGKKALEEIATVAQPDTILAWHRTFADQKADTSKPPKSVGRPRIDKEIEDLVVRMARENRSWGYDRIQGALKHLGYTISDQTVGNVLKRHSMQPAPERKKTVTWGEFVRFHLDVLLATDFFTSEVWTWLRLVLSSLLFFFIPGGRRQGPTLGMTRHHHVQWLLALLPQSLAVNANVQRWVGLVKATARSCVLLHGKGVPRHPLSQFTLHDHQECLPQSMSKLVRMPAGRHRPIRDGPMQCSHRLGRLLKDDNCKAA
jgi:transposase